MKTLILYLVLLSPLALFSQSNDNYMVKVGTGLSLVGDGDGIIHSFSTEMYSNLNRNFATSGSFFYGYGVETILSESAHLFRADLNVFFSPFGNRKRYNFEVGTGVSYHVYNGNNIVRYGSNNGVLDVQYEHQRSRSVGYNLMVDNTIKISEKHHVSFGAFITPFLDGNINSGFNLKYGYRLGLKRKS